MSDHGIDWVGQTLSGGRYRVDAKLGEGGMGFVYKVWDRNLDTEVVIKAPRKSMLDDPEFSSRFALEIRSLVKLSHPHIVKVSDVGEHDGVPFAVMQYLTGGTLDERQELGRTGRPLPAAPSSISGWLPGMAAALDFIHGKAYIHRDVKPANILFDGHGHPYLSDFGVAKVLSDVEATSKKGPSGMTGIGIVLGTPEYMAPELIMGNTFDARVDQYALAVTVYEILCGRKPFEGETSTAILVRQTTEAPPPMAELPASTAGAISAVILRAMSKKPGDRYPTCVDFSSALIAALAKVGTVKPAVNRLACPNCGATFAATADLSKFRGRKSKCQACGVPFRVSLDGLSLTKIDDADLPTPSGSVEIDLDDSPAAPARAGTMKMDAMPSPARAAGTMKMDAMPNPARAAGTMKMAAMPAPARAAGTMKMAAMPGGGLDEPVSLRDAAGGNRSMMPFAIGGGVGVLALILGVVLVTRPAKDGSLAIVVDSPVPGAYLSIDGKSVDLDDLKEPVKLSVGDHALEASGKGLMVYKKTLKIEPGSNSPLLVKLSAVPKPQAPAPTVVAARTPESSPTSSPSTGGGQGLAMNREAGFNPTGLASGPETEPPADKPADDPPRAREDRNGDGVGVGGRGGAARKANPRAGQLVTNLTLKQILQDAENHEDDIVSPSDLVMVNTQVNGRPGMNGLSVRTKEGGYQSLVKDGTRFDIVLKPELDAHLSDQLRGNILIRGEYPAILKMRIVKQPGQDSYLGVVEWLEFLYYIDARFLVNGTKLNKALFAVILSSAAPSHGHTMSHEAWAPRLVPSHVITNVRNAFKKEGEPPIYGAMAADALQPNWKTAPNFHKWIMARIK